MSDIPVLRIATRTSPLALWQATHVAGLLATAWPGIDVEVVPVDTEVMVVVVAPDTSTWCGSAAEVLPSWVVEPE